MLARFSKKYCARKQVMTDKKKSVQNIQVVCRFRPQNELEKTMEGENCVEVGQDQQQCTLLVIAKLQYFLTCNVASPKKLANIILHLITCFGGIPNKRTCMIA